MERLKTIFTRTVRKYIYLVALAAVPLVVALGWADPQILALALPVLLALLNLTPDDVRTPWGIEADEQAAFARRELSHLEALDSE